MSTQRAVMDRELASGVTGRREWWLRLAAPPGLVTTVLALAGAVLLGVSAAIHFHLWSTGYRHIPTIGPLFLLQGIAGVALAVVVAVTRRAWATLLGAGFAAGTIAGLLLSVEVGLFGFKDSLSAPYATLSLVVESAATVVLAAATLTAVRRRGRVG